MRADRSERVAAGRVSIKAGHLSVHTTKSRPRARSAHSFADMDGVVCSEPVAIADHERVGCAVDAVEEAPDARAMMDAGEDLVFAAIG